MMTAESTLKLYYDGWGTEMQRINVDDFDMYWHHSKEDGTLVLAIETRPQEDKNGLLPKEPKLRLYLNDECVFENPPYPGDPDMDGDIRAMSLLPNRA